MPSAITNVCGLPSPVVLYSQPKNRLLCIYEKSVAADIKNMISEIHSISKHETKIDKTTKPPRAFLSCLVSSALSIKYMGFIWISFVCKGEYHVVGVTTIVGEHKKKEPVACATGLI